MKKDTLAATLEIGNNKRIIKVLEDNGFRCYRDNIDEDCMYIVDERGWETCKYVLDSDAIAPNRAHKTDAGLDLFSREEKTIPARGSATFDTGVHFDFPKGCYGKIESKSGLNVKHSIVSCGGTIDQGFTGSVVVKVYNLSDEPYQVKKNDKIAQIIIQRYETPKLILVDNTNDFAPSDRGNNGFGSTGR